MACQLVSSSSSLCVTLSCSAFESECRLCFASAWEYLSRTRTGLARSLGSQSLFDSTRETLTGSSWSKSFAFLMPFETARL